MRKKSVKFCRNVAAFFLKSCRKRTYIGAIQIAPVVVPKKHCRDRAALQSSPSLLKPAVRKRVGAVEKGRIAEIQTLAYGNETRKYRYFFNCFKE